MASNRASTDLMVGSASLLNGQLVREKTSIVARLPLMLAFAQFLKDAGVSPPPPAPPMWTSGCTSSR